MFFFSGVYTQNFNEINQNRKNLKCTNYFVVKNSYTNDNV